MDPNFKGWQDVYWFCGSDLRYCTCSLRWNLLGWMKALALWNFVLTSALGLQKLVIQVGLNGLLPGEEVVTKESFISICWRLIPYWLNNWEQQWGTECSSMMFELPHFAVELLVILPSVQILCSRMKILALPLVQPLAAPAGDPALPLVREEFAPNILKGFWEHSPAQAKLMPRLKANLQIMTFTVFITCMAAFNALVVPLYLEKTVSLHASTLPILTAGRDLPWASIKNGSTSLSRDLVLASGIPQAHLAVISGRFSIYVDLNTPLTSPLPPSLVKEDIIMRSNLSATPVIDKASHANRSILLTLFNRIFSLEDGWELAPLQCPTGVDKLADGMKKHANEITKMLNVDHMALIPLVESALALMRLSCEKYFVLVAVFVSYLLFREPPRAARAFIIFSSRLSSIFQKVILYSFPAICWIYGAGFIFSTFVSVVFWGSPIHQLYQSFRGNSSIVRIKSLKGATAADIERMGGSCAICWGDMRGAEGGQAPPPPPPPPPSGTGEAPAITPPALDPATEGFSLQCGHAYHHACLHQWLHQCHSQGTTPTCPMCQATIQLEIQWRMPWQWKSDGARRRRRGGRIRGGVMRAAVEEQEGRMAAQVGGDPQRMLALPQPDPHRAPLLPLPNDAANQDDLRMLGLLDHEMEVHELLRDMPQILPPGGEFLIPPDDVILPGLHEAEAEGEEEVEGEGEEMPQVPPVVERQEPEVNQVPLPPPPPQSRRHLEPQNKEGPSDVNEETRRMVDEGTQLIGVMRGVEENHVPSAAAQGSSPHQPGPSTVAPYVSNRNGHRAALLGLTHAEASSSSMGLQRDKDQPEISPEEDIPPQTLQPLTSPTTQPGGDGAATGARPGGTRRRGPFNFFGRRRQA